MVLHTKRLLLFFICSMSFFASAQNFETYYTQAKEAYEKQVFDSKVFDKIINEIEVKFHNYNLTLERLDSVIKICPDLSKYPDLIYYKGMIYFEKEFYSLSIKTLLESKDLAKNYSLRYDIYNNLGICYTATKQIDLATRAFEEAMNIADKNKNQYDYAIAYENLLLVKIENGDLESLKKLELNFLSKDYEDLCAKLENLSLISGYYLDHNLYKQSEEILNNVSISTKTIDSCFFQKQMYYENWANISIHNNQYNKALSYLDSIPLKQIKLGVDKIETFKLYKKAYQQLKNNKKSISYNDSVVRVLEDKLENFNTANTIEAIKTANTKDLVEKRINKLNIFLFLILFTVAALVVLLIYSRKTRYKLKRKLFFYKEKYNSLWANYQLSTKQLENLRQELIKQNKQGNSELNSVLKDLSIHFNTNKDDEHKHINIAKENFINKLTEKANYLNDTEKLICFFINLNLSHQKIASLIGKTEKSIDSYKYRINTKVKKHNNTTVETLFNQLN